MAGRKGTRWGATRIGPTPATTAGRGECRRSCCRLRWQTSAAERPAGRAHLGIEIGAHRDRPGRHTGATTAQSCGLPVQHHGGRDRLTITPPAMRLWIWPWPPGSARVDVGRRHRRPPHHLRGSHFTALAGLVPWALVGIRQMVARALAGGWQVPARIHQPGRLFPPGPGLGCRTPGQAVAGAANLQIGHPACVSPGLAGRGCEGVQFGRKLRPAHGRQLAAALSSSLQLPAGSLPCTRRGLRDQPLDVAQQLRFRCGSDGKLSWFSRGAAAQRQDPPAGGPSSEWASSGGGALQLGQQGPPRSGPARLRQKRSSQRSSYGGCRCAHRG